MLKTAGIPWWATIFTGIVFLLGCFLGLTALAGHGMELMMTPSWGGRTLGLGLVAGLAVLLKSPVGYLAAFIGGTSRELGDLIGELSKPVPSMGIAIGIAVFLIADIACALAANSARRQLGGSHA